jgi:hypothetical protein
MKQKVTHAPKKDKKVQTELPFKPVDSKSKINLSPEVFTHSTAFSKMMDRAHRLAMRRNDSYSR